VIAGEIPATPLERERLSPEEISAGWRLACCSTAECDLVLEVGQWHAEILADESEIEFTPQEGLGIALDLGTTTLVAQLVDLRDGQILAVETSLNPQARYGADIMSRIQLSVHEGKQKALEDLIRGRTGQLVKLVTRHALRDQPPLRRVVVVGNTVMHHLFCGIDLEPLAGVPFEPKRLGLEVFRASDLGWDVEGSPEVRFLPCLGGFVGSDLLAGILATRVHLQESPTALLDLGTNGEIVIGSRDRILCASTAAGPAFEGARISRGMRAASGAIAGVARESNRWRLRVLGGGTPTGICGSGLVDAVSVGLDLGLIQPSGKLEGGDSEWKLCEPVSLTQKDIRELQLAKGAIAAGVRILLEELGLSPSDVRRVHLAGAFGNYVDRESARRIGLYSFPAESVEVAGNAALHGAKLALFARDADESAYSEIRSLVQHVSLADSAHFQDLFVEAMTF
jgi:uncharacterized 2Fe-2S/4Fe-4S cluster protein (DUF4445 family)